MVIKLKTPKKENKKIGAQKAIWIIIQGINPIKSYFDNKKKTKRNQKIKFKAHSYKREKEKLMKTKKTSLK